MAKAEGIRSYGPGKYSTIIDSYVHGATIDFGADHEESYPEGGGWYGFMALDRDTVERILEDAAEAKDRLTKEEEELLDESLAVILFERSDGIVEVEWYDDLAEAEEAWAEIEEEFADLEGDE
jgi:hypothetical protein